MSEPKIAATSPVTLDLEAGDYFWCACGLAAEQPLCDGSHKGSGIPPVRFHLEEAAQVTLCRCKRTKNPPYCDGSHRGL